MVDIVNSKREPVINSIKCNYNVKPTSSNSDDNLQFINIKVEPDLYFRSDITEEMLADELGLVTVKAEPLDFRDGSNHSCFDEDDICLANIKPCQDKTPVYSKCIRNTKLSEEISQKVNDFNANRHYSCRICVKSYSNKSSLKRHQIVHSGSLLKCEKCLKEFWKSELYDRHIANHKQERSFECNECTKAFKTLAYLLRHSKTHRKRMKEPLICTVCFKEFTKTHLLKSHMRRHVKGKPFSCELCPTKFKYESTLLRHMQLHDGIKPFSCNFCGKSFTHAALMKPHLRTHTGEKPFRCSICDKSFAYKHNMQRHVLRHAKIKRLICDICQKRFPKESRLKYHMKTHTDEKPFSCLVCPKRFTHKQNVLRHYSRKHPDDTYHTEDTDASIANDLIKTFWRDGVEILPDVLVKEEISSDDEGGRCADGSSVDIQATDLSIPKITVDK